MPKDKYDGLDELDRDLAMCNDGWQREGIKSKSEKSKKKK